MNTPIETPLTNTETIGQQNTGNNDNVCVTVVYPAAKVCEHDGWVYYFNGEGKLRKEEIDSDGFEEFVLPGKNPGDVHTSLCIDRGWLYCLEEYAYTEEKTGKWYSPFRPVTVNNKGYRLFRVGTDGTSIEDCCDFGNNFNPNQFLVCDGWVYYLGGDEVLYRVKTDASDGGRLYEGVKQFCIVDDLLIFEDGQDICKATIGRGDETIDITGQAGRSISIVVKGISNAYDNALWYADSDWIYYLKSNGEDYELHQALADCNSQVACRFSLNSDECGDVKQIFVSDEYLYLVTQSILTEGGTLSLYRVEIENAGDPVMVGSVDEDYCDEYSDIHLIGDKLYFTGDNGCTATEACL